jgi:hypothetical protein
LALSLPTIFAHLGKCIKYSNSFSALASTTLPAALQAICAEYGVAATTFGTAGLPIEGINASFAGYQQSPVTWQNGLLTFITNTLTDIDTVISQIPGLSGTDINTVLAAIIQYCVDNAQSFTASVVTVGSVTPASVNVGNGNLFVDATLDGYNAPAGNSQANTNYNALLSQLVVPSETLLFTCVQSSGQSGVPEGSEVWTWQGGQAYGLFDYHAQGSGTGPGLTTANGATIGSNMNFESSSANLPTSWTAIAGVPGTDFVIDNTVVYRGAASLKLVGTGSAQPELAQSLSPSLFNSKRRYLVTFVAQATGTIGGTVKFRARFTGTGYSPASTEKIDINASTISVGSWTVYHFYINIPNVVPANWAIDFGIYNANLTNATDINVDSFSITPVPYWGGINAQINAGSVPWVIGDRLSIPISNNNAGFFQTYFGNSFGVQLSTSGSPTISDSLAT